MIVLGIDPGAARSAWILFEGSRILNAAIEGNAAFLDRLRDKSVGIPFAVAIEHIEPRYGQRTGWETIRTAYLVGALAEAARPLPVVLLCRSDILRHLGVVTRGPDKMTADSGVRAALMDRWGGADSVRKGGPLAGIKTHLWSALAVGVTFAEAPGLGEVVP